MKLVMELEFPERVSIPTAISVAERLGNRLVREDLIPIYHELHDAKVKIRLEDMSWVSETAGGER